MKATPRLREPGARAPIQVAPVLRPAQATGRGSDAMAVSASGMICGHAGCVEMNGLPVDLFVHE